MESFTRGKLLYKNPLDTPDCVKDFVMEGQGVVCFPGGKMQLENALDEDLGQKSNFVFWCPEDFEGDVEITWQFKPLREPGLAIMFFHALGLNGEDIFAPTLPKRTGEYNMYHSGEMNCYHIAYFRRRWPEERAFHTCNLRKSKGFHLVAQGGDPIPGVEDAKEAYTIKIVKRQDHIYFFVDNLLVFTWHDDGSLGAPPNKGKIGFRQMAPLQALYWDLEVWEVK